MTENKDNASFDAQVKLMLENAAEPVPAGVWSGVSGALARRERRMGLLLLLRRTGYVVAAAAAALVAGLFLYNSLSEDALPISDAQQMAAVAPLENEPVTLVEPETVAPVEEAESETIAEASAEPVRVAMATRKETVKAEVAPAVEAEKVETETAETVETETAQSETVEMTEETAKMAEAAEEETPTFDIINPEADLLLADAGTTRKRSGRRFSLNAGGVLESNLSPVQSSVSGRRRVGQGRPRTGITETPGQSEYDLPLSFGAGITWHFSERWGIGTGLTYTYLGRSFSGTYTKAENGLITEAITGDIHSSLHYIGVPLNLSYTVLDSRNVQLYGFAEGMVEKALTNRFRIEGAEGVAYYHQSVDGVQYSFGGGLGVRFRLTDHLGLYLNPSLRYYPKCDQPLSIRTQEPLLFSVEAGLRFDL